MQGEAGPINGSEKLIYNLGETATIYINGTAMFQITVSKSDTWDITVKNLNMPTYPIKTYVAYSYSSRGISWAQGTVSSVNLQPGNIFVENLILDAFININYLYFGYPPVSGNHVIPYAIFKLT